MGDPKTVPYRNRQLLDLADGQACVMCGAQDGTVVSAHANGAEWGKGGGRKADDCSVAWLCCRCHLALDQGRDMSAAERRDFWLTAHARTVRQWFLRGLVLCASDDILPASSGGGD